MIIKAKAETKLKNNMAGSSRIQIFYCPSHGKRAGRDGTEREG